MGGPQSPATTAEECPHFNAWAEQTLIKKAIDADKIVLGVCLGAQLIGEALGAKFEHNPHIFQFEHGIFKNFSSLLKSIICLPEENALF